MFNKNKLSVSFANIKNIKTNYLFAQKMIEKKKINFFSETWLSELDKGFLNEISLESQVLSRSDFIFATKGRPFGGVCWFVDKDIKIIHHEFVNEHVSFIVIEYGYIKWLIVGAYMPFDNN
jgi:hypothetical protein